MNTTFGLCAALAAALALSACGGDDGHKVAVDDLATGSYIVAVGSDSSPTVGKYYASTDGSRLLALVNSADQASQIYRRSGSGAWIAVPAASTDVSVSLLRSTALTSSAPTVAALAGSYVAQVATGVVASFTVDANGNIVAGASSCKLTGALSTGTLPNTLKLSLSTSNCGSLPLQSTGVVTVDADYAPAKFRLLTDNSTQILDLWAYAE